MSSISRLLTNAELSGINETDLEIVTARYDWVTKARRDQLPPTEDYLQWLLLGGRGAGKTRTGAEETWWQSYRHGPERVAIVAPTNNDVRKTCFEGESGLLAVIPDKLIRNYNRSALEMWLTNGTYFVGYSAEEPERLRGPQHHRAWCDELGAWNDPQYAWDMLMFGLRLGPNPQTVITTTPRPTPLLRSILADPDTKRSHASTLANRANLPPRQLAKWLSRYEGTRLGRQELNAEMLDDMVGALWQRAWFDATRIRLKQSNYTPQEILAELPCPMRKICVAVDPSGVADETDEDADEVGITVQGQGVDGRGYVLADYSMRGTPGEWALRACQAYEDWKADGIIAEINYGGAMVEYTIKTQSPYVPVTVITASRGKVQRAQPVSSLYEQGRVSHVGPLSLLEDQMCQMGPEGYTGAGSPDRVDSVVWGITYMMVEPDPPVHVSAAALSAVRKMTPRRRPH